MTDIRSSEERDLLRIDMIVDRPQVAGFFRLLQQGVLVRRRVGCSVEVFLREQLGATAETIGRIQSIMLDGKPVDDIAAAVVHDGSTLALSAAMPGLVGATLRRSGAYSSFRGAITYHESGAACATAEGWVKIKVFNLLMKEMGPGLLGKGIVVESRALLDLLAERMDEFGQGCGTTYGGSPVDVERLRHDERLAAAGRVLLTVTSREV